MQPMPLSENAQRVLEARYLRRDREGALCETPDQLFARVARAVAHAELLLGNAAQAARWEQRFYDLLSQGLFLPNSPTLMNAGTPLGQLSACFVLPVEDTMESIFGALREMALVQRTGGGTGFSFGRLRPAHDPVASTGGTASGPVSFMRIFDGATEHIKLGGKRRGANMGVLPIDHPDVLDFIDAKRPAGRLRNFNLSLGVSDAFMAALEAGARYDLHHPRDGRVVGHLPAPQVFDRVAAAAWATGDPGLLFLDTINRTHPTPALGRIAATNPCGEVPLLPYESCNLGSLNLPRLLAEDAEPPALDWPRLAAVVSDAVRFLDDVLTVNRYVLPEIEARTLGTRKIGLGVMGFAELLLRLGLAYGGEEAVACARQLMRRLATAARRASTALAAERGVFPTWPRSRYPRRGLRLRNATLTSIAPTGTLSIIAGTTSGIEPLFALAYRRVGVLGGATLSELNPLFLAVGERRGVLTPDVLAYVTTYGTLAGAPMVPEALRALFATALEIEPRQHLRLQATFQGQVDNAVSKTINLPADATPAAIAALYREAYRLGLKGITIYRYGSIADQVLQLGLGEEPFEKEQAPPCDPDQCRL